MLFVDGNDYVVYEYCKVMSNLIKKEQADMAYVIYYLVRPTGFYANRLPFELSNQVLFLDEATVVETIIAPKGFVWNKIYRKECIGQINFSQQLPCLENYFLNLQVVSQARRVAYTIEPLYYY